jgi:hypothetical protein
LGEVCLPQRCSARVHSPIRALRGSSCRCHRMHTGVWWKSRLKVSLTRSRMRAITCQGSSVIWPCAFLVYISLHKEASQLVCRGGQDNVLNIVLAPHGTFVLNIQAPNRQIWLSSPLRFWLFPSVSMFRCVHAPATQVTRYAQWPRAV